MTDHTINLSQARALLERISNLPPAVEEIADERGAKDAADLLLEIKAALKEATAIEREVKAPLQEQVRAIAQWFAANLIDPLMDQETMLKRRIGAYQETVRRNAEAERRRAEEAAAKERARLAKLAMKAEADGRLGKAQEFAQRREAVVETYVPPPPKQQGISTRTVWKFRIVDEGAIPREYLLVDEAGIRKVVSALKGKTSIPGVEVYQEQVVVARAGG
jgi:hypothetical protein